MIVTVINENFIYLGVLVSFLGCLSYLRDTLKGNIQPNKVSWFVWALAPLIAFFATIQQGVGIQSLLTFMVGFNPLLIFLASFVNKKAYWKLTKLDFLCGILAILGLILWQITAIGNIAILFGILADLLAGVPTIIKSYKSPETENPYVFLGGIILSLITLLTITTWTFEYYAFPFYIFVTCILIFSLIKFKVGKLFK
jgi:hypothetical protein